MRFLRRLFIDFFLALVVFILLNKIFLGEFVVRGNSMTPSVFPGERILVLKFPKLRVKRCDIIVFLYPRNPQKTFIKRVIGLPGEELEIKAGKVFANGKRVRTCLKVPADLDLVEKIPLGFFFVLGDNFQVSNDSRYGWLVPEEFVIGKALAVYWPIYDLRRLK